MSRLRADLPQPSLVIKESTDMHDAGKQSLRSRLRKRVAALTAVGAVLACVFASVASPAVAEITHNAEPSFNGASAPGGTFELITALAVDGSNGPSRGDVYVGNFSLSTFESYVEKFEPDGSYAGVSITSTPSGPISMLSFATFHEGGLAVDGSTGANSGDLYVSDPTHGVVDKFTDAGAYVCQITGAATPSATECNGAASSLTPQGSFEPSGLAVEASTGDLYAVDVAHNVIDKFGPAGEYMSQFASSHITEPGTIALDGSGHLYVENAYREVLEFNTKGVFISTIGNRVVAASTGPSATYAYLLNTPESGPESISEYEFSGAEVGRFGEGEAEYANSLAVGPAGRTYAGRGSFGPEGKVYVFGSELTVPSATAAPVTAITQHSAVLNGRIDPDAAHGGGPVTGCTFEYVEASAYNPSAGDPYAAGHTASCSPAPPYAAAMGVSGAVGGLAPDTVYHWRLVAENADGSRQTIDQTFTAAGPATIEARPTSAEVTNATVRANIDPYGYETKCHVEYVTEAEFQAAGYSHATTQPCTTEDLGEGFAKVQAMAKLKALALGTVYHYRFVAESGGQSGPVVESDRTFETFGVKSFEMSATNALGEPYTQAGGRPYQFRAVFHLTETETAGGDSEAATGNIKNVIEDLPPGLIGNPTTVEECTSAQVTAHDCSGNAQVGVINPLGYGIGNGTAGAPLYNVVPGAGQAARFEAEITAQIKVAVTATVRGGTDYGVSSGTVDIQADIGVTSVEVVLWGAPAEASHNGDRACPFPNPEEHQGEQHGCASTFALAPFLRMPTLCTGKPLVGKLHVDSWQDPGVFLESHVEMPPVTGCGVLPFAPSFEAPFTSGLAESPTGLNVDLHNPQPEGCKEEAGKVVCENGEADLRDVKIAFPAGMTIDSSSADGLQACSESQVGYLPQKSAEVGYPQFTPDPAECPDAAKIGSVEVKTPLLNHPLPGAMYIATQNANPFKTLLAVYIAVYDPASGVVIKLPSPVELNPTTGQLSMSFEEDPQLPFEDFRVNAFSGSRAVLTTPATCGSYSTSTEMTPWSAPEGKVVMSSSKPSVISGAPGGASCVSSEAQAPNAPLFTAGTASSVAGSFSPFVLHLAREDASQHFSALNVTLPPGLIGKIAGLQECPQAAIEAAQAMSHEGEGALELAHPSCPSGSEIGVVHVGVGSGAPFYVTGHVYFAGPYKGAPFSLVIVTPAVGGPFDLGTVVVRAGLYIDPSTAQVTVKSDPFPTMLYGIPLDIRSVDVEIARKEFTLNPTSCSVMSVTGQELSTAGQSASLSDRFQAGGCTTLPFHPVFEASTSGVTSRKEGASLIVHVASGAGQSNIAKVHVVLPKQLPSRDETLKLACTESVFAANPASCPAGSQIGTAVAHTPILASALTGPVYLVSHGGAAFPDVEVVLQSEGVTIVLDGKTNIQNGVTESSFEAVPDAPVSSFEMSLPEGPHSILAAPGGGLCSLATQTVLVKKKVTVKVKRHGRVQKRRVTRTVKKTIAAGLVMPTTIQGQNGAVINQSTPIAVTGCTSSTTKSKTKGHAKHKKPKTANKHAKKHG